MGQGERIQIVGEDIFVTNLQFVRRGTRENVSDAVLIKLHQIGAVSEAIRTVDLCHSERIAKYNCVLEIEAGLGLSIPLRDAFF